MDSQPGGLADVAKPLGIRNTAKQNEDGERPAVAAAGIEQVDDVGVGDVLGITADRLERVRRELGLVRLSWQKRVNLESVEKENLKLQLPESYRTISDIEKTLFWYAENFRRQYRAVYPHRKPLLLTCANECAVQKFVSTSIRRTLLPYAELSTWQGCASFVSDHFAYEPPVEPLLMPDRLHSPTHLLRTRRGNSFELATFLVSLLLGLGYNAYVVSGYASREQTLCDQTRQVCPYLPRAEEPPPEPPALDTSKYRPSSPPDFKSRFLEEIEQREREKAAREIELEEDRRQRMIMELERPSADRHFGQRIHAWVALLPGGAGPHGAEIAEALFIEPATGVSRSPRELETANVYLGIESLWNNRNYWLNVQDCTEACAKLDWDLRDVRLWEHLLPGEPREMRNVDDDEDEEVNVRREYHMIMPASYVDKVQVAYADYEQRYPSGRKTIHYKKCKVELFAPYLRPDGLIESVTKYEDYEYERPIYVYEKFRNRCDKLERTEKDLGKETATDHYAKGRPDACKVHRYFIHGRGVVDEERTLEFYDGKRFDELSCIKMHPLYASQEYKRRDDRLYNRRVEYSSFNEDNAQNDIHYRVILKIVEKFHRNEAVPAGKDVAIREFDFVENEIRLTYHYSQGQYTQATRTFIKPPVTERGDRLVFLPEMTHGYDPDPMASPEDFDDLIDELEKQLIREDASIVEIRNAESELFNFLQTRATEFLEPKLKVSIFDPIRNHEARAGLLDTEEKIKAQSQREIEKDVDFLSPYLARLGDLKYLTKKQASQIRNDCIEDFKRNATERANGILQEFEKCSNELENLQSILTQAESLSKEDKEQLLDKVNEMNLKLRALELRLNRHRELVPPRYRNLLEVLQQNRRISILYDE